jgi:hypothetical protein
MFNEKGNRNLLILKYYSKKVDLGEDANLVLTEYFSKLESIKK